MFIGNKPCEKYKNNHIKSVRFNHLSFIASEELWAQNRKQFKTSKAIQYDIVKIPKLLVLDYINEGFCVILLGLKFVFIHISSIILKCFITFGFLP